MFLKKCPCCDFCRDGTCADEEFDIANYTIGRIRYGDPNQNDYDVAEIDDDGFLDPPCLEIETRYGTSLTTPTQQSDGIYVYCIYNQCSHDPAEGKLQQMDFSIRARVVSSDQSPEHSIDVFPIIHQGDKIFGTRPTASITSADWVEVSATGLEQDDFFELTPTLDGADENSHPDWSNEGSQLRFGFGVRNFGMGLRVLPPRGQIPCGWLPNICFILQNDEDASNCFLPDEIPTNPPLYLTYLQFAPGNGSYSTPTKVWTAGDSQSCGYQHTSSAGRTLYYERTRGCWVMRYYRQTSTPDQYPQADILIWEGEGPEDCTSPCGEYTQVFASCGSWTGYVQSLSQAGGNNSFCLRTCGVEGYRPAAPTFNPATVPMLSGDLSVAGFSLTGNCPVGYTLNGTYTLYASQGTVGGPVDAAFTYLSAAYDVVNGAITTHFGTHIHGACGWAGINASPSPWIISVVKTYKGCEPGDVVDCLAGVLNSYPSSSAPVSWIPTSGTSAVAALGVPPGIHYMAQPALANVFMVYETVLVGTSIGPQPRYYYGTPLYYWTLPVPGEETADGTVTLTKGIRDPHAIHPASWPLITNCKSEVAPDTLTLVISSDVPEPNLAPCAGDPTPFDPDYAETCGPVPSPGTSGLYTAVGRYDQLCIRLYLDECDWYDEFDSDRGGYTSHVFEGYSAASFSLSGGQLTLPAGHGGSYLRTFTAPEFGTEDFRLDVSAQVANAPPDTGTTGICIADAVHLRVNWNAAGDKLSWGLADADGDGVSFAISDTSSIAPNSTLLIRLAGKPTPGHYSVTFALNNLAMHTIADIQLNNLTEMISAGVRGTNKGFWNWLRIDCVPLAE